MLSKEELVERIAVQKISAQNDDSYNQTERKKLKQLERLLEFHNCGVIWQYDTYGIRLKHRYKDAPDFIVTLNKRWRVAGHATWYWYSTPTQLVGKLYPRLAVRHVV